MTTTTHNVTLCKIKDSCPGCKLWDTSYTSQKEQKINHLKNLFSDYSIEPTFHSYKEHSLRERFDFIIKNNQVGLLNKNKEFVQIKECLQLTPDLQNALNTIIIILSKTEYIIKLGTLRLRSSNALLSKFGLWLDLANVDIKNLLIEKTTLLKLHEYFFIEIGQKKKTLKTTSFNEAQIKLDEPLSQHWFQTIDPTQNNSPIALNCAVSSFTQPSRHTANIITHLICNLTKDKDALKIWEFGSGIGQYTFPLLLQKHNVTVFENDSFAIDCLQKTATELNLTDKLRIKLGDFQNNNQEQIHNTQNNPDLVLVNPPKSGLRNFANTVIQTKAEQIIYISCFPESLKLDAQSFLTKNYRIADAHIIDQFPQTDHYEVFMLFERINI